MAKSKTYTYQGEVPGSVVIPATGRMVELEPGDTVEAETEAEEAAYEANPDLASGSRARSRADGGKK
jgi:hypothetical protein